MSKAGKAIAEVIHNFISHEVKGEGKKPERVTITASQHIALAKYRGAEPEELTHFEGVELRVI